MYVEKRVSRCRFLLNKLVYGIILLKFYVRGTITQILGNWRRMRTITHAICTRPFFFFFFDQRSIGEKTAWERG